VVAWVFHARIATHGAVGVANCHPFEVGLGSDLIGAEASVCESGANKATTYLAHNGVLDVKMPGDWTGTDSEFFAQRLFPLWGGVGALNVSETWDLLEGWLGSSKVVLLSNDASSPFPLVVLNDCLGTWEGDVWYSNTYHRYGYGVNPSRGAKSFPADDRWFLVDDDDECVFCGGTVWQGGACADCHNCGDCFMSVEDCRCVGEPVGGWC
jgi:glutamine amidotransferase